MTEHTHSPPGSDDSLTLDDIEVGDRVSFPFDGNVIVKEVTSVCPPDAPRHDLELASNLPGTGVVWLANLDEVIDHMPQEDFEHDD